MIPQWIIEQKRDGQELDERDIRAFIDGYASGEIPDYQMSALAMAIYFQGMTAEETGVLTDAMMRSGQIIDTSAIDKPKADKHSTGGIGDKVSLILAPLVACCGVAVPMISGRGLGITGGTLDKMESIPGYRCDLSESEFVDVIAECGCSIIGQTEKIAPADKKFYALRDVTATVPSIPLITASIMSKKLAEGIDALVLDVKHGGGAFMKNPEDARRLAESLVDTGKKMGKKVVALLTDMNEPLGRAVGNSVEVGEAIECLRGEGPRDLMDIVMKLSGQMLILTEVADSEEEALAKLEDALESGRAYEKFRRMVESQGGDPAAIDDPSQLPQAEIESRLEAESDGVVAAVDAEKIGKAALELGSGRVKTSDDVDHAVGISAIVKSGTRVSRGDALAVLHANDADRLEDARATLNEAFLVAENPLAPGNLIGEIVQ